MKKHRILVTGLIVTSLGK